MKNRSQDLRDAIEELIATGQFPPGHHLDETELAARFKVSRTPSILAVRADSKFADMKALLAEARTAPEKVSYGSTGEGGILPLA